MNRRTVSLFLVSFTLVSFAAPSTHGALVGHWTFNNGSSTSALLADSSSSGSNNSGSQTAGTAPVAVSGVIGTSMELFGNANINVGSSADFDDTSFTVSGWLYNDPGVTGWRTAFSHWTSQVVHYGRDTSGVFGDYGGGQTSGTAVVDATWYHVVSRRGASGPENSLWVNGVKQAQTSAGTPALLGTGTMKIGARDGANFWDGRIDDLGYFSTPLSDAEILATYNLGLPTSLGSTFGLNYDLGEAEQLFDAFNGAGSAKIGLQLWLPANGLNAIAGGANAGDLFTSNGGTYLLLDSVANGGSGLLMVSLPEPSTAFLLGVGLVGLVSRRRRNASRLATGYSPTSIGRNQVGLVLLLSITMLAAATTANAAIVTEYRFESGARLLDSAASGSVGDTLSVIGAAVSYEAGVPALATGGNNDEAVRLTRSSRLQAVDSPDLDISTTWTLEMFINPDDTTGAFQRLMTKWFGATTEYHFAINNNGMDLFANGAATSINDEGAPLTIGDWSYLAVTNDSANGVDGLKGYINGSLVSTGAGITITPGTSPLDLGFNDAGNGFAGLIDEIRIHNTEQSLGYIQGRANLLTAIPEPSTAMLVVLGASSLMFRRRRSVRVQS